METRANYLLVGGFVLAFSVGMLGFVIWLAKFQFDTEIARYDILFEGSVTGLQVGNMIFHQIRRCPQPSIRAASTRASGIWAKNCRNMKI